MAQTMEPWWDNPTLLQCLGVMGTVLSNGLGLANLEKVLKARRFAASRQSTITKCNLEGSLHSLTIGSQQTASSDPLRELQPVVFIFLTANCTSWCMYSASRQDPYMFAGNILGVIIGLLSSITCISLVKCQKERLHIEGLLYSLLFLLGIIGFAAGVKESNSRQQMLGSLSLTLVLFLYASPFSTVITVVRTKNSISISRPFCVAQMANCVVWSIYGWLRGDMFTAAPNAFGLAAALLQAFAILLFPAQGPSSVGDPFPLPEEDFARHPEQGCIFSADIGSDGTQDACTPDQSMCSTLLRSDSKSSLTVFVPAIDAA
jgi:uncharacterized protein with PQ loop repeat